MEATEAVAGGTHKFSMLGARAAETIHSSSCRQLTGSAILVYRAENTPTGGVFVKACDAGTRILVVRDLDARSVLLTRNADAECIVGKATIIDTHKVSSYGS